MNDSEEETREETVKNRESRMRFVNMLRDFPMVFSKSQTPAVRKVKSQSLELIKSKWEINFGTKIATGQLLKKISNMKTRLKKKIDNKSRNKKIVLHDWEKILMEILEDTNPVRKIPGAMSVGTQHTGNNIIHKQEVIIDEQMDEPTPCSSNYVPEDVAATETLSPNIINSEISPLEQYETHLTKNLSNSELKRLVLLKQLNVLNMKEEKLRRQLNLELDETVNLSNISQYE